MQTRKKQEQDNTTLWENRELGSSAEFAQRVSPEEGKALDDALGLQPVSIRLQKELVDSLRLLAKEEGLGYQPFIRRILTRYVKEQTSANR